MEHHLSDSAQAVEHLIDKQRWNDILGHFIDVLRISILLVDKQGKIIVSPKMEGERKTCGEPFLAKSFHLDLSGKDPGFIQRFSQHGSYWEARDLFDFHAFAVPIHIEDDKAIAYLIVGPVILHKKWSSSEYEAVAGQAQLHIDRLEDLVQEVRVVSFVTIKAILDLLATVAKDIVQLSLEKKKLRQSKFQRPILSPDVVEAAQDIFSNIHRDDMLLTLLDVTLSLTRAESGSIMIVEPHSGELTIKVSKGLEESHLHDVSVKMGEGVAGIAAQENALFFIKGNKADPRIKHLLKRPDIKESAIIPLAVNDRVLGVMNLNTTKETGGIGENVKNIKNLSKLISTAIVSSAV